VISAYFDGGARGNPGVATNNMAEYRGLLAALRWAVDHGVTALHVRGDSLLLVQQMRGVYRVKNEGLLPLYREARHLCARIGQVSFEHIPRKRNTDADRLSNAGMDQNTR
jgi:ribonuclease HI